jgi:hypothetical protein
MSNTVSPFTGRLSPNPMVPYEATCDPLESIIPTTIPVACFCKSTRVDNIFRIASSSGIGEACDGAAHIAPGNSKMQKTQRRIGLTRMKSATAGAPRRVNFSELSFPFILHNGNSFAARLSRHYRRGFALYVAHPIRSIHPLCMRDTKGPNEKGASACLKFEAVIACKATVRSR